MIDLINEPENNDFAECKWGPLDGEQWAIPKSYILVVRLVNGELKTSITKLLLCGDLPKRFRDDPTVLGWYNYVIEFSLDDSDPTEDDSDGFDVIVRAFHAWYTKQDQIGELIRQEVQDSRKRSRKDKRNNKKPGWMLTAEEIESDYYEDDDPADDWKQ